jgi:hypothetical protein
VFRVCLFVCCFPLISLSHYPERMLKKKCITTKVDTVGVAIGRRYKRNGISFLLLFLFSDLDLDLELVLDIELELVSVSVLDMF